MEKFLIVKDLTKKVRRFNLKGRTLEFKLKPVPEGTEPVTWIKDGIDGIIQKATEELNPMDQISFSFGCKDFARGDGWIRFRPAEEVTFQDVWDVISSIYQSNSTGLNTETFCLGVTSVRMPAGRGKRKSKATFNTFEEECRTRRGIVTIKNSDNLCFPRALVVAIAFTNKDPEYKNIRQDIGKMQLLRAEKLVEDAGVHIPEEGAGIPELQKLQEHLKEHQIIVYRYGSKGRDIIFEGSNESDRRLNLLYHEGHYNVITSLTAAFACGYFCEDCHVPYDHKNDHRCGGTCPGCQRSPKCSIDELKVKCDDCQRYFRGQSCYDNHRASSSRSSSVCDLIKLCPSCLKTIKSDRNHTCGEVFCNICNSHQPRGHLCFMNVDTGSPKLKNYLYVFYDLETRQEKQLTDGSLEHEPNLCVFKQCCEKCIQEPNLFFCQSCGFKRKVLQQTVRGANPVALFLTHLFDIRRKFKDVIVLAHNRQAFDHQFILNHIMTETDLTPELIMRGTKIIMMQLENIKFLDSINYFPMSLSKLPKAFELSDQFKKGYFPHLFNREENKDYVGPLPSIEFYSPDSMMEDERAKFLQWYEEHKNDEFNFQKEIVEYCVSDVDILSEACLKFREQMMSTTNVCPFSEACTIASACNKVFRRNFLKPNTIGIIPKNGYRYRDIQSKIALQWLIWEEKQRDIDITFAAKGPETILHGLQVDGFCEETNQVFEFQGCFWHGCPTCYKFQRDDPLPDNPSETLNFRYESTLAKTERLRSQGYDVIEQWECSFRRQLEGNSEIRQYVDNHPMLVLEPLKPRDAFYGGRTGNCQTYYKVHEGEKIKYLDVCSLYPWVCKYGKFPFGHPEVFVGEKCKELDLKQTDGLIKAKILPPQDLFHPVLPLKMNNKLMFVLCRTCGNEMSNDECRHIEDERALTGTWVIDEVLKALEKGYKIMDIYEVWKYQVEQYAVDQKTGGLFTEMMNKFIKIKVEATGWPADCVGDVQKQKYIDAFFNREGVKLEFQSIAKNQGLRSLAKLMLNSFWGKLGQQENQPKTAVVNNPQEFFNMLTNPSMEVNSALPINEDVLLVNYTFKEESYEPLPTVNVCLAAYTTAQARLKLYSYLEELGERVLYYDTDSVIYTHEEGQFEPPTGDFTGDMTDELEGYGSGSFINEFVSGGPKNYAYKFYSTDDKEEKIVCKVKGICLNYTASRLINFDSIKEMVLKDHDPIPIVSKNIRRTKDHRVVTVEQTKLYRPNSKKRKFLPDGSSEPYGFKKARLN